MDGSNLTAIIFNVCARNLLWIVLVVTLALLTFGVVGCLMIWLNVGLFIMGFLSFLMYRSYNRTWELLHDFDSLELRPDRTHLLKLCNSQSKSDHKRKGKTDSESTLTGSKLIDDSLEELLNLILRDFVYTWYRSIAVDTDDFIEHLRESSHKIISNIAARMQNVDWVPFVTTHIVDDFATHIRLYRKANEQVLAEHRKKLNSKPIEEGELESMFFDLESEMERNYCRDLVSSSSQYESAYLRDLSDILLYLILPREDFTSKPFRLLLREFLTNKVLRSSIDQLADPDYINQTIVWLLSDIPVSPDDFLSVIEVTDHINELTSVLECLDHEIAMQRSKDKGGQDNFTIKQQLSSLYYVKRVVCGKIKKLQHGEGAVSLPERAFSAKEHKLMDLSLGFVLNNPVSVSYFIDFLNSLEGGQNIMFLFLAIEGYKVSAEQHLSNAHLNKVTRGGQGMSAAIQSDLDTVREAALMLYEQYLSERAVARVSFDESLLKKLLQNIKTQEPSESWFDHVQAKVYERLQDERYYPAFKKSQIYVRCLAELDLLRDSAHSSDSSVAQAEEAVDHDGTASLSSAGSGDALPHTMTALNDEMPHLNAYITKICLNRDGNKVFAIYNVHVASENVRGESLASWNVLRRYSDFLEMHRVVETKFPNLAGLSFPGKKTFNNLNKDFLEKRRRALNNFLQTLLLQDVLKHNSGLEPIVTNFLSRGPYDPRKGLTAKKLDAFSFMNPILSGVRTVGSAVVAMPDTFVDGVFKMGDGLGRMTKMMLSGMGPSMHGRNVMPMLPGPEGRVGAGVLDTDGHWDNIPLRIMLLLMDEVFNLRQRNQWFRRRLVGFLQQVIRAVFGSSFNKRIVDFVAWLTCEEQVAEYIKSFKNSFWPNGVVAEPAQERPQNIQMRTRVVAKARMLAALPDELRIFIGNETTRTGTLMVFEAFQNPHLNRRFVYVLLEHFLRTVFPNNRFEEIFVKLHSKSPRCQAKRM